MRNKKGAIELSVNFIVVIVLSIAIISAGFVLFYKVQGSARKFVADIDQQTQERLQAMMLNNNYDVAVYPNDITLSRGDSALVGLGITNNYNKSKRFKIGAIMLPNTNPLYSMVTYYANSSSNGVFNIPPWAWGFCNQIKINQPKIPPPATANCVNVKLENISSKDSLTKGVLITMPKNAMKGQYVIKLAITTCNDTAYVNCDPYGITKIYVTYP